MRSADGSLFELLQEFPVSSTRLNQLQGELVSLQNRAGIRPQSTYTGADEAALDLAASELDDVRSALDQSDVISHHLPDLRQQAAQERTAKRGPLILLGFLILIIVVVLIGQTL